MNKAEYKAQESEGRLIGRLANTPPPGMIYKADCVVSDHTKIESSGPDHILSIRHCAKQIINSMSVSELKKIFDVTVIDPREYQSRLRASHAHGYVAPPPPLSPEQERHMQELYESRLIEIRVGLELTEQPYTGPNYIRCYKNGTLKK